MGYWSLLGLCQIMSYIYNNTHSFKDDLIIIIGSMQFIVFLFFFLIKIFLALRLSAGNTSRFLLFLIEETSYMTIIKIDKLKLKYSTRGFTLNHSLVYTNKVVLLVLFAHAFSQRCKLHHRAWLGYTTHYWFLSLQFWLSLIGRCGCSNSAFGYVIDPNIRKCISTQRF